jgi:hypothetical protein
MRAHYSQRSATNGESPSRRPDDYLPTSRRILDELYALNQSYLALLVEHPPEFESQILPANVTGSLVHVCASGLALAARCPFSLFAVTLDRAQCIAHEEGKRWRRTDAHTGRRLAFAHSAVFFAWHLATERQASDLLIRCLLGLNSETTLLLRTTPLAQLSTLALDVARDLTPRWPDHAGFWPSLVQAATDHSGSGMVAVRLLGRQLLAAEDLNATTVKPRRS